MKRSEINLTIEDRIRILRQQCIQLLARNQADVVHQKKQRVTANKEYLTLVECQELCEAIKAAGITWQELRDLVELSSTKRRPVQKKLFHP